MDAPHIEGQSLCRARGSLYEKRPAGWGRDIGEGDDGSGKFRTPMGSLKSSVRRGRDAGAEEHAGSSGAAAPLLSIWLPSRRGLSYCAGLEVAAGEGNFVSGRRLFRRGPRFFRRFARAAVIILSGWFCGRRAMSGDFEFCCDGLFRNRVLWDVHLGK